MASGSIRSTASIASTPMAVRRVPPARTVGRRQLRNARVTSPRRTSSRTSALISMDTRYFARHSGESCTDSVGLCAFCVRVREIIHKFLTKSPTKAHESAHPRYPMRMSIALETVLAKAGLRVSPGEFLGLVEDAARRLSPPNPNPAEYFSADQRETLTEVGLDLR